MLRKLPLAVLVWLVAPVDPGPPDRGGDRPDMQRRKRVDPSNPPDGYYESGSPPLRQQVLRSLAAVRDKITGFRRGNGER
jgi:hypothetical protein